MKAANNIQTANNRTTQIEANSNIEEAIKMTTEANIHGLISLTFENLKPNRATSIVAGLAIGGMIAAATLLPGNASADTPARPIGDPLSVVSTANVMDMDLLDPGFYDAKLASTSNVWESPGFDPYENVAAKVIRASTGDVMDMDLLDPGFYDAKLVSGSASLDLEGLQSDNII